MVQQFGAIHLKKCYEDFHSPKKLYEAYNFS